MSVHLPKAIELFMSSENAHDADALAECFASDATVRDEGRSSESYCAFLFFSQGAPKQARFEIRGARSVRRSLRIVGLVVLQLGTNGAPRLFANRLMLWMGERSYSFYLAHIWVLYEIDHALGTGESVQTWDGRPAPESHAFAASSCDGATISGVIALFAGRKNTLHVNNRNTSTNTEKVCPVLA